ncbi:MAG: PDZ domain-containing protein [Caldilineaceae bacterium]|nr:PDZ domain-containing protein [Caldilineaceae bacterium]
MKRVGTSIVRVDARRRHAASGVVWSADGLIVTAHHVVESDEQILVGLADGATVSASLVGRDPATDLAVLRAEASDLVAATWVDAAELSVGHFVLALGRPGRTVQATFGIVSALGGEWRTHGGGHIDHYLQTDVVMYPGFSGGPLVEASGKVAGLNTSALARGVSLSLPAATVQRVVQTLLEHGRMPRGYLGVSVQPVRLPDGLQQELGQETGVMVMSVEADGPAAQAGIVQGDILASLEARACATWTIFKACWPAIASDVRSKRASCAGDRCRRWMSRLGSLGRWCEGKR